MNTASDEIKRVISERPEEELDALRKVNPEEIAYQINIAGMEFILRDILQKLRANKPSERSERSRHYAVTITEMEKVYAYFKTFVVE